MSKQAYTERPEHRTWLVPYEATVRGTTVVEAETAEAAIQRVNSGVFDLDPGQEMVDWASTGTARENV